MMRLPYRQAIILLFMSLLPDLALANSRCETAPTPISSIQGVNDQSPLLGQVVTVQAFVSAVYQEQKSLKGFFLVEPLNDQDQDPRTSEGIFVYSTTPVIQGQHLSVTGKVAEYYGLTELTQAKNITACPTTSTLPEPVSLPRFVASPAIFEQVESMPVITDTLWITGNSQFVRYGELSAHAVNRFTEPMTAQPFSPSDDWVIDDGFPGFQSRLTPFVGADDIRLGTQVAPFKAMVSFGYGHFRLLPLQPLKTKTDRPAAPVRPQGFGNSIAQLNVRNFFNGDGKGGGFPTSRGAKRFADYQQQLRKLTLALQALDADIIALTELENDGYGSTSAISDLVKSLNQDSTKDGDYRFAAGNPNDSGSDVITQGVLYKPAVWDLNQSDYVALDGFVKTPNSVRPAFVTTLTHRSTGHHLQLAVVHFRSRLKGCAEDGDNEPAAGFCYLKRLAMSQSLDALLPVETDVAPDLLVIAGDLNAYLGEPAIDYLEAQGWTETRGFLGQTDAYTYVYQDKPGALDHFLLKATPTEALRLQSLSLAQTDWHINAPESDALIAHEASLGRITPYRSSDHDPSILYFNWP